MTDIAHVHVYTNTLCIYVLLYLLYFILFLF